MAKRVLTDDENPASFFISGFQDDYSGQKPEIGEPQEKRNPPVRNKVQLPSSVEHKSKRLNLLIQPTLYADLTKVAYMKKISLNELILVAAREFRNKELRALEQYDVIFSAGLKDSSS